MPKVTGNLPFQPGEAITADLMNRLGRSADTGRLVTGDGSSNVQMVGGTMGIGANLPFKNSDKDILAILRAPLPASSKTPALGGGTYYGSTFNQGLVLQDTTQATLTIVRPVPTLYNCIIVNGSENLATGHAIIADTPCVARFMGYSAPNAQGVSFPLLFTRIESQSQITFQVTSDFAAGTYWGRYKAKSYLPNTGTATSPGTLAAAEDIILINGAEWMLATSNNLLVAPNTTTFAVIASGMVVGSVTISSVVYKIVVAWIGFAACTNGAGDIDGGGP